MNCIMHFKPKRGWALGGVCTMTFVNYTQSIMRRLAIFQRLLYHDMLLVPKIVHVQHCYVSNGKMKVKKVANKSMMNDLVWVKR
jgi:hypothetical protein